MPPSLRERLAARHIEIPHGVRDKARKVGHSLSEAWRRDAALLRQKTARFEAGAEHSLKGWFARLKPKVVRIEHRMEDAVHALARRTRRSA